MGPAYAWSHMKICTTSSGINALFSYSKITKEHPPDEIRMRAILQMLHQIGQKEEGAKIQEIGVILFKLRGIQSPMIMNYSSLRV